MLLFMPQTSLTYLIDKLSKESFGKLLIPSQWISNNVQADADSIHQMVDCVTRDSRFLQGKPLKSEIARFHNDEILTGDCLIHGYSSETHEIVGVYCEERYSALSDGEEATRLHLVHNATYKGHSIYALKQVIRDLQTQHEVHMATFKLLLEAEYLTRIDHPNIIRSYGVVSSGKGDSGWDRYDDLAIIVDKISENLHQRIEWWSERDSVAKDDASVIKLKTEYALQIAEAISYLHSHRLILQNFSAQDIGFGDHGIIKLINMENIRELPECGTSSDEECKNDVYAFAVIFFEMLVQKPVAEAFSVGEHDAQSVFDHCCSPNMPDCGFIPYNIQDLLFNAWSSDVKDRLDIDEVVDRLEWILYGYAAKQEDIVIIQSSKLREIKFCPDETNEVHIGLDLDTEYEEMGDTDLTTTSSSFLPPSLICDEEETISALDPPLDLSAAEYSCSLKTNISIPVCYPREMARCA